MGMYGDQAIGNAAMGRGQDITLGGVQEGRRLRDRPEMVGAVERRPGLAEALENLQKATSQAEETVATLCDRLRPVSLGQEPCNPRGPTPPERPICDIAQALQVLTARVYNLHGTARDALDRLDF